jgi:hypothetical protein
MYRTLFLLVLTIVFSTPDLAISQVCEVKAKNRVGELYKGELIVKFEMNSTSSKAKGGLPTPDEVEAGNFNSNTIQSAFFSVPIALTVPKTFHYFASPQDRCSERDGISFGWEGEGGWMEINGTKYDFQGTADVIPDCYDIITSSNRGDKVVGTMPTEFSIRKVRFEIPVENFLDIFQFDKEQPRWAKPDNVGQNQTYNRVRKSLTANSSVIEAMVQSISKLSGTLKDKEGNPIRVIGFGLVNVKTSESYGAWPKVQEIIDEFDLTFNPDFINFKISGNCNKVFCVTFALEKIREFYY